MSDLPPTDPELTIEVEKKEFTEEEKKKIEQDSDKLLKDYDEKMSQGEKIQEDVEAGKTGFNLKRRIEIWVNDMTEIINNMSFNATDALYKKLNIKRLMSLERFIRTLKLASVGSITAIVGIPLLGVMIKELIEVAKDAKKNQN